MERSLIADAAGDISSAARGRLVPSTGRSSAGVHVA